MKFLKTAVAGTTAGTVVGGTSAAMEGKSVKKGAAIGGVSGGLTAVASVGAGELTAGLGPEAERAGQTGAGFVGGGVGTYVVTGDKKAAAQSAIMGAATTGALHETAPEATAGEPSDRVPVHIDDDAVASTQPVPAPASREGSPTIPDGRSPTLPGPSGARAAVEPSDRVPVHIDKDAVASTQPVPAPASREGSPTIPDGSESDVAGSEGACAAVEPSDRVPVHIDEDAVASTQPVPATASREVRRRFLRVGVRRCRVRVVRVLRLSRPMVFRCILTKTRWRRRSRCRRRRKPRHRRHPLRRRLWGDQGRSKIRPRQPLCSAASTRRPNRERDVARPTTQPASAIGKTGEQRTESSYRPPSATGICRPLSSTEMASFTSRIASTWTTSCSRGTPYPPTSVFRGRRAASPGPARRRRRKPQRRHQPLRLRVSRTHTRSAREEPGHTQARLCPRTRRDGAGRGCGSRSAQHAPHHAARLCRRSADETGHGCRT